ncbi:maleylpyruvate isomerase N-terminal domain-containing protein [Actinoplanes sp. DH11]|uniref:maleylpyruvate isomerase N-terminal domain-containing protein n=1 Tax=Actinoplanes sp. DH11 TaxID=2857011 RepID=UPI001E3884D7|nr:maleylpyruvate isomerase N-terminal domain-containing protein [Actinoplanes sp. DH11]
MTDHSLTALRAEATALITALGALTPDAWERPTRCEPWLVRDVVGHIITVLSRVPDMVAAPAPEHADTSATDYYRPDHRFSDTANTARIAAAQDRAAAPDVTTPTGDLSATVTAVVAACRDEPAGRVVRTRHGDAMLLTDFLTTRVAELAIHGLDVADALRETPCLTAPAARHLQHLLFGPDWRTAAGTLGWDPVTLLRKTTGRAPVTATEAATLTGVGLRRLTLG